MADLRLFEIEDGIYYWLGAASAAEALERYRSEVPDAHYSDNDVDVREVSDEEAEALNYVDGDGHRLRSMGEQLQKEGRDMIACSEW